MHYNVLTDFIYKLCTKTKYFILRITGLQIVLWKQIIQLTGLGIELLKACLKEDFFLVKFNTNITDIMKKLQGSCNSHIYIKSILNDMSSGNFAIAVVSCRKRKKDHVRNNIRCL